MREDAEVELDDAQARAADAGNKAMMPIGIGAMMPRPFLDYVLSAVANAGCRDVCLVIGPDPDPAPSGINGRIRDYYASLPLRRLRISFAVQEAPLGTANAVLAAEGFAGKDEFLVLNGDNYYPVTVLRALVTLGAPGLPVFEREALVQRSNIPPERVNAYAIVDLNDDGSLARIVEKPDASLHSNGERAVLVSMNVWRFSADMFRACREAPPSPRGEYELPIAVQYAIDRLGARFLTVRIAEGVLDLSRRSDIPLVAGRLRAVQVDL